MDMQHIALAVDISDLQTYPFQQAQPAGIDRGQADAITLAMNTVQNASNFFHAQDHRQFPLFCRADQVKCVPGALQSVDIKELDPAQCDDLSAARNFPDVLQIEKIRSQFFLADLIR